MSAPTDSHQPNQPATVSTRKPIPFRGYNQYIPVRRTRGHLPHWTQPGATYFITFRLGDSVPIGVLKQLQEEREKWLRLHPEPWSPAEAGEYHERFGDRIEEWLDRGCGECHLRAPEIRRAVQQHLLHHDQIHYDVDSFVLMPNHVHALLRPQGGRDLFSILQGIKGTSACTCNKLLGRRGQKFWMEDSFNRIVRDADELFAYRRYIAENPMKAGLKESDVTVALNNILQVQL